MRLRNPLFAPADSERKIQKALASAADAVILDLEDSVAVAAKETARLAAVAAINAHREGSGERSAGPSPGVIVRVNPYGTPWHLADLAAVVAAGPDAILLPKCNGPDDLRRLDHHLEALETAAGRAVGGIGVLALATESALALQNLHYRGVTPRLRALLFGAEDLSADFGIAPRHPDGRWTAPIAAARAALLTAAAAAGVPAIDTPFPDTRAPDALRTEAAAAVSDGFSGKQCIHPDQIAPVAALFTPSPDRIAWARAVRDLFAGNPQQGVLTLDGRMLDGPHLKLAERILSAAFVDGDAADGTVA